MRAWRKVACPGMPPPLNVKFPDTYSQGYLPTARKRVVGKRVVMSTTAAAVQLMVQEMQSQPEPVRRAPPRRSRSCPGGGTFSKRSRMPEKRSLSFAANMASPPPTDRPRMGKRLSLSQLTRLTEQRMSLQKQIHEQVRRTLAKPAADQPQRVKTTNPADRLPALRRRHSTRRTSSARPGSSTLAPQTTSPAGTRSPRRRSCSRRS